MKISLRRPDMQSAAKAKMLYTETFPADERRPWEAVINRSSDYGPWLKIILADGSYAGFITVWQYGWLNYIEHFAVLPSMRGKGIGGCVLTGLLGAFNEPWVLEVERENGSDPATGRRIRFYESLGFGIIDDRYIQPPYAPGLPEVPMYLMGTEDVAPEDVDEIKQLLKDTVYKL